MDALDVTRALLRRWYAVLPLLVLTALGVVLVGERVQPEYHAKASMLMLGPGRPVDVTPDGGVNPYRTAGLSTTTQALVQVVDSPAARQQIAARALDPGYVVKSGERTPIIEIQVASDSEKRAVDTARGVERLLESELKRRQDAVRAPAEQRLSLGELAVPTTAFEEVPGLKRARVVVLGLGLLLTLVVGLGLDGLLLRRARRRSERGPGAHASSRGTTSDEQTSGTAVRPDVVAPRPAAPGPDVAPVVTDVPRASAGAQEQPPAGPAAAPAADGASRGEPSEPAAPALDDLPLGDLPRQAVASP